MNNSPVPARDNVPITEYVHGPFVPLSHLAHGWELHSSVTLSPAEERTMVREPAQAVPASIAQRIGKLRVLIVPYVACRESGDEICNAKPSGETHTSAWVEGAERTNLILPCRELDAHDTGFEFLASVAELFRSRLNSAEVDRFTTLLEDELRASVGGEIDDEAQRAKQAFLGSRTSRRSRAQFERYRDVSFVSTLAEYFHGLWHDVQIRVGPEHLPVQQLRRRMTLLAELFPPNEGYRVFAEELEKDQRE